MKTVIWGTGYYASVFTLKIGRKNIAFYIDKDIRKRGKNFLENRIYHPDDIKDWNNLFVYVPYNYYDEIGSFLQTKGLIPEEHFTKYYETIDINLKQTRDEYLRACSEVEKLVSAECKGFFGWWGRFWSSKEEYRNCLQTLKRNGNKFIIASDTPWYNRAEVEELTGCPAVVLPCFIHDFIFIKDKTNFEKENVGGCQSPVMSLAENIHKINQKLSWDECYCKAYYAYRFIDFFLNKCRFKALVIGSSDAPCNMLVRAICKKYNIPTLFTHQAMMPGTIMFGPGGDIGSSVPAVYCDEFRRLPISSECVENAKKVVTYLYKSKANRKAQPKNSVLCNIKERIKSGRPIIVCMGQNDPYSAMVPYTEFSKRFHSPIFKSSVESAEYLAKICKSLGFNFIYKPHPMYARYERLNDVSSDVIIVNFVDVNDLIDMADVVVTIRSSINYIALIRQKPVLMLGYSQTRGQGCTYEAFHEEYIETQLKKAVQQGFTNEQKQAFLEHVARLLQYYLYDDMSERPIRYGLPWPERVEDFFALENKLKEMQEGQC